jgi:scyllo-inositol 2-dehydrogenase (NADP+)
MSGQPIGVGLVGYGVAGSSLHAPLIGAEPGLRLRAVVSRNADRVHRDLESVQVVPTAAELLADPEVRLVVVAAPNAVHGELAAAALRAGRHVVVDKPFTVSSAEADELIALAARQGRLLAAFHQRRWDGDFRTVERCVRDGVLGRVGTYAAHYDRFRPEPAARWRERDEPGAGLLYDLGPHLVDQALHLFGPPETVVADVRAQRPGAVVDDYFHLVLGYGRLRVILHAGSLVRAPGPRFAVHGDAGSLVTHGIDGQVAALLAGRRPGDDGWGAQGDDWDCTLSTEVAGLPLTGRLAGAPGAYETFYRELAAAIRGEGPVPVPAEDARDSIRVLETARRSSADGRTLAVR